MDPIFQSLQTVVDRYDELNEQLADPEVASDGQKIHGFIKRSG